MKERIGKKTLAKRPPQYDLPRILALSELTYDLREFSKEYLKELLELEARVTPNDLIKISVPYFAFLLRRLIASADESRGTVIRVHADEDLHIDADLGDVNLTDEEIMQIAAIAEAAGFSYLRDGNRFFFTARIFRGDMFPLYNKGRHTVYRIMVLVFFENR